MHCRSDELRERLNCDPQIDMSEAIVNAKIDDEEQNNVGTLLGGSAQVPVEKLQGNWKTTSHMVLHLTFSVKQALGMVGELFLKPRVGAMNVVGRFSEAEVLFTAASTPFRRPREKD